jgi:hypothetical protein
MYTMTEFLITSYLYSSQDYNRQPTKNKHADTKLGKPLLPTWKLRVRLNCGITSLSHIWLLASFCEESFLEFFCRVTENIWMHANTIDFQVLLPNVGLKIIVKRHWNLNLYIWTNLRLMMSAIGAILSSLDMCLKSCAFCCNPLSIVTSSSQNFQSQHINTHYHYNS